MSYAMQSRLLIVFVAALGVPLPGCESSLGWAPAVEDSSGKRGYDSGNHEDGLVSSTIGTTTPSEWAISTGGPGTQLGTGLARDEEGNLIVLGRLIGRSNLFGNDMEPPSWPNALFLLKLD